MTEFIIFEHQLVPLHRVLSEEEKKKLYEKYKITANQLPKISIKDPAIKQIKENLEKKKKNIKIKSGDVVEITRTSETAGKTKYYRVIVND